MSRLSGRVVATTRDGAPEDPLTLKLESEGARVLEWPTLAFAPPDDDRPLRHARAALDEGAYDWVVVTSARAVAPLGTMPERTRIRVAAVGRATARALEASGWRVDVVGDSDAEALVGILEDRGGLSGARVLFPAASLAGDTVEEGLSELGARVERVEAYRTVRTPPDAARVREDLVAGVSAVAFASPSAVRGLVEALGPDWPGALDGVGVAAIGPSTAGALEEEGIAAGRIATADPPSLDGLVDACVASIQDTKART